MVKVLKTKSGYYLVFKDDVTLTDDEVRRYKDTEYNDRRIKNVSDFHEKFSKADAGLTKALMAEIPLAPFLDKQVKNELSSQNELKNVLSR